MKGLSGSVSVVRAKLDWTTEQLKEAIEKKDGTPAEVERLIISVRLSAET